MIADALLTYLQANPDGGATVVHQRFLELDRATLPVHALVAKLTRYARLYHFAPDPPTGRKSEAAWRSEYPAFPAVHVLLAGAGREALERRLEQTVLLAQAEPQLKPASELQVSFALLEDLTTDGPFEQIFVALAHPERLVDWVDQPEPTSAAQRAKS